MKRNDDMIIDLNKFEKKDKLVSRCFLITVAEDTEKYNMRNRKLNIYR